MKTFVCITCGTQYSPSEQEPSSCPICEDDRQYVIEQKWTTLEEIISKGHENKLEQLEKNLWSVQTEPKFAIGQRAILVKTEEGNVLWDCVTFIDDKTVQKINELGGIKYIILSHPHFFASMVEWANRFDAKIIIQDNDKEWIQYKHYRIETWVGKRKQIFQNVSIICLGGHFPGSCVLLCSNGANGKGALLSADTVHVLVDRKHVTWMYSFPNMIPLPAFEIERMTNELERYEFDRIHGAWMTVQSDAKDSVRESAARYLRQLKRFN
jgi:hypothetical protein